MSPVEQSIIFPPSYLSVIVDGQVLGKVPPELAYSLVARLRLLKTAGTDDVYTLLLSLLFQWSYLFSFRPCQPPWKSHTFLQVSLDCTLASPFTPPLLEWCVPWLLYPMAILNTLALRSRYDYFLLISSVDSLFHLHPSSHIVYSFCFFRFSWTLHVPVMMLNQKALTKNYIPLKFSVLWPVWLPSPTSTKVPVICTNVRYDSLPF